MHSVFFHRFVSHAAGKKASGRARRPTQVDAGGEIGITGAAAAGAHAVYHATGKPVRDLPITLDKLL